MTRCLKVMKRAFETLNAANEKAMGGLPGGPKPRLQETNPATTTDIGEGLEARTS